MTPEERQLLLKDLCARLPYKPKIQWDCADYNLLALENCEPILARIMDDRPYACAISKPLEEMKPYLRPMSSMTEEELMQYKCMNDALDENYEVHIDKAFSAFDWLNEHHFDYRGLIEKGLAIEAPEGMY